MSKQIFLTQEQIWVLEDYLLLFVGDNGNKKYSILKKGVRKHPDVDTFWLRQVERILSEGQYEDTDRKMLNHDVRKTVSFNRDWIKNEKSDRDIIQEVFDDIFK